MRLSTFRCAICEQAFPDSLKDEHHKVPQSLGGTDEPSNLVGLCKGDHQALHMVAFMLVNPKRKHEIEPTLLALHPQNLEARKRLMEFSMLVAKEMFLKKETKKDATEEIRAVVELPQLYMELIRLAGYDTPRKNGKPVGVSSMVRLIVADFLSRKYPMKRDDIYRLRLKSSNKN